MADCERTIRQPRSFPIVAALEPWLREKLALVSQKSKLAEAIRYALSRWAGVCRFLDDGRVEIDTNVVERSIRPIALNRRNALFAGSDGGAEHWAVIASLVETAKLNTVEPQSYLADVIAHIVEGHPQNQIDDLLPWEALSKRAGDLPPPACAASALSWAKIVRGMATAAGRCFAGTCAGAFLSPLLHHAPGHDLLICTSGEIATGTHNGHVRTPPRGMQSMVRPINEVALTEDSH